MVWFQCEDCGENLKKPKLSNHFRICSSYKLSCIDCGQMFDQQSVQSHTQCISEAEKYGPKGEGKASQNSQSKPVKPKPNSDVDVNVGLSSRAPWFCSLCNTYTTSQQTLLGHADGKKHRAKARAFHAAQKPSNQTEESTPSEKNGPKAESTEGNGSDNNVQGDLQIDSNASIKEGENETQANRKRKLDASVEGLSKKSDEKNASESINGEVIQTELSEVRHCKSKKKNTKDVLEKHDFIKEASESKIKWKKLVTSILKTKSDGTMKIKKLQKLIMKALEESGVTEDEGQLQEKLMQKARKTLIKSSSRFTIENKHIRLVKNKES
ncbi:UBP1-associated proteins 1C [Iris pallida]|uniref:UBP1-associated proteins 1C n=1 Tax=Iris pallida TaxID=29817 RepID=A0AAX6FAW9_IRIPA|nr:UBP1-associated proteins 1C [Iris pallida]